MRWRRVDGKAVHTQKEVDPKKKTVFVIEKYIEDVKQKEKDVPDLVESIMKGSGLVKEELRKFMQNDKI